MSIINPTYLQQTLGISQVVAERVMRFQLMAEVSLRRMKGDVWYDSMQDVYTASLGSPGLLSTREMQSAMMAECFMALYHALPSLNLKLLDSGGVLAVEWTTDKMERRFLSLNTLEDFRSHFLAQAKLLIDGDVMVEYSQLISSNVSAIEVGGFYLATSDGGGQ